MLEESWAGSLEENEGKSILDTFPRELLKVLVSSLLTLHNSLSDRVKIVRIHNVSCSDGIVGAISYARPFRSRVKYFPVLIVIVINTSH